jgi:hypothetical protein
MFARFIQYLPWAYTQPLRLLPDELPSGDEKLESRQGKIIRRKGNLGAGMQQIFCNMATRLFCFGAGDDLHFHITQQLDVHAPKFLRDGLSTDLMSIEGKMHQGLFIATNLSVGRHIVAPSKKNVTAAFDAMAKFAAQIRTDQPPEDPLTSFKKSPDFWSKFGASLEDTRQHQIERAAHVITLTALHSTRSGL